MRIAYPSYVYSSGFAHTVLRVPKDLSCPSPTCLASRGSYAIYLFISANVLCFCIVSTFTPVHIACLCVDPQKLTHRTLCTKSDEVRLAEEASKKYCNPAPTIFSKVIDKSIPADIIYEDEKVHLESRDLTMYSCIQSIHSTSLFTAFCYVTALFQYLK